MAFKCKDCGWHLPETSFHQSADDIEQILLHGKTCPKKNNG